MILHGKTLADLGEFDFIRHIRRMMPGDGGAIVRSIGDDCLVTEPFDNYLLLSTTDTFVEGIHFKRNYSPFTLIGERCMSASVSDIAAMSGIPMYSLLSLSMPPNLLFSDALDLFSGLQTTARMYCCPIAGGETTSTTGPVTITVTVFGKVEQDRVVYRSGARECHSIYVTGFIGDAMAGLLAFNHGDPDFERLKVRFLTPEARVSLSRALTQTYRIASMIDLSDGLATDIRNICDESLCGAELFEESLPLSDDFQAITRKYGIEPIGFALSSGEDFELLFTSEDTTLSESFTLLNHHVTRIGTITGRSCGIMLRRRNGEVQPVDVKGYEHFKT